MRDDEALGYYDYHHSMVVDELRSGAFLRAIFRAVKPGDVVIDLGAGTGLLSLFAITAGARRVYAVESEAVIDIAREVARVNKVDDRIEFLVGKSTDVELPEPADVLITETIGNAAFDEGILAWVADSKLRHLRSNATIIPERLTLVCALLEVPRDYADMEKLASPLYTFDLSPLKSLATNRMTWDELSPVSVVSDPLPLIEASLYDPPAELGESKVLTARRDCTMHAVGFWFEAVIFEDITLSNAPPNRAPSWNQGVVMLDEPLVMTEGEQVGVEVAVTHDGASWKYGVKRVVSNKEE